MHPNAAQGYSQIVEDIGVLEYLVSQASPAPDSDSDPDPDPAAAKLPRITSAWEEIRKPRVRRIQEWARFNSALFTGDPGATAKLRRPHRTEKSKSDGDGDGDDSAAYQVRSLKDKAPDMNADFSSSAFLKWTQSYDAVDVARKYLQSKKSRL